ncbi:MAG: hypothetical protein ACPG5L_08095 [Vibrio gallaecicus]
MKQLAEPGKHYKPRRRTQDRLTKDKPLKVSKNRKFIEQLDDLTAAVFGDLKGNMRTVHNRTLASK